MAKVLEMKTKAGYDGNWREVLVAPWEYGDSAYSISEWEFPVCNHTECLKEHNLGYVKGLLKDNRPFEAELYYGEGEYFIAVIIPVIDEYFKPHNKPSRLSVPNKKGNVLGIAKQQYCVDNSVLPVGMIVCGEEDDLGVTSGYVDYLKDMGLIRFSTDVENGFLNYYKDLKGNQLVQIVVTLKRRDVLFATTTLEFRSFFDNKKILDYKQYLENKVDLAEKKIGTKVIEVLDDESIKNISFNELRFIEFSESGAMGIGGEVALYLKKDGKAVCFKGNFCYGALSLKKIQKFLKPVISIGNTKNKAANLWHSIYLGAGHYWFIHDDYYKQYSVLMKDREEEWAFGRKSSIAFALLDD